MSRRYGHGVAGHTFGLFMVLWSVDYGLKKAETHISGSRAEINGVQKGVSGWSSEVARSTFFAQPPT